MEIKREMDDMIENVSEGYKEIDIRMPIENVIGRDVYVTKASMRSYVNTIFSDFFFTGEPKYINPILDSEFLTHRDNIGTHGNDSTTRDYIDGVLYEDLAEEYSTYGWKSLEHHTYQHQLLYRYLSDKKIKSERLRQLLRRVEDRIEKEGNYSYQLKENNEYMILPMQQRVCVVSLLQCLYDTHRYSSISSYTPGTFTEFISHRA